MVFLGSGALDQNFNSRSVNFRPIIFPEQTLDHPHFFSSPVERVPLHPGGS